MLYQKHGKNFVQNNISNNGSLTIKNHHIIQRTRIVSINKLNKPTSQTYFEKMFPSKPIKRAKYIYYHAKLHTTHICDAFNIKF